MRSSSTISGLQHLVAKIGFYAAAAGTLFIMLLVVADITLRRFGLPIQGAYEIVQLALVISIFLGLGYTQVSDRHVRADILVRLLPTRAKKLALMATEWISFAIVAVAIYCAGRQVHLAYQTGSGTGVLQIALWPFYILETLGLVGFALALLLGIVVKTRGLLRPTSQADSAVVEGEEPGPGQSAW